MGILKGFRRLCKLNLFIRNLQTELLFLSGKHEYTLVRIIDILCYQDIYVLEILVL